MPYIKREDRKRFEFGFKPLAMRSVGDLNFVITKAIQYYLAAHAWVDDGAGSEHHRMRYQLINDCIGALECAKLELFRRVAIPLEKRKIKENGDVYPAWMDGRGEDLD